MKETWCWRARKISWNRAALGRQAAEALALVSQRLETSGVEHRPA
jgi:hypothetical protein